jgi:hypothetical protein
MPAQLGRILDGRHAQRRMRHGDQHFTEQACRPFRRQRVRAEAQRQVHAVALQVHHAVGGGDAHVDLGRAALEGAEPRQQPQGRHADGGRDRDARPLAGRAQGADHGAELFQHGIGGAEQVPAFRREFDAAVGTDEQAAAERRLQRLDLAADRGLHDAQVLRGERDAHAAADRDEGAQQVERRQVDQSVRHSSALPRIKSGLSHAGTACDRHFKRLNGAQCDGL